MGTDVDYLLPRIGDSDIVLLGIFTKPQEVTKEMDDEDNRQIAAHIKDSLDTVVADVSIESKSASDDAVHALLKVLCVRDETGNDIAENLKKLCTSLDEIQDAASDDDKLLAFVKANRSWLTPPPPPPAPQRWMRKPHSANQSAFTATGSTCQASYGLCRLMSGNSGSQSTRTLAARSFR